MKLDADKLNTLEAAAIAAGREDWARKLSQHGSTDDWRRRAEIIESRTECTDGTIIQEFLTPEQAAEWADLARDAAADALMRGDGQ